MTTTLIDGFEDGNYTSNPEWREVTGSATVDNTVSFSGTYSLKMASTPECALATTIVGRPQTIYYCWIRSEDVKQVSEFSIGTGSNGNPFIARMRFGTESSIGRFQYFEVGSGLWKSFGSGPSNNTWYKFQITYIESAATAQVQVFDSGEAQIATQIVDAINVGVARSIYLDGGNGAISYYDDIQYGIIPTSDNLINSRVRPTPSTKLINARIRPAVSNKLINAKILKLGIPANELFNARISVGKPNDTIVLINGKYFDGWDSLRIVKKTNQVSEFECHLVGILNDDKAFIKEDALAYFYSENFSTLLLKGQIQRVEYETEFDCTITGYGMETKLLNAQLNTRDVEGKSLFTNTASNTIVNKLCSVNDDGSSPWVINVGTNTNFGNLMMRFDVENKLRALAAVANATNYDWWISQDGGDNDLFNIGAKTENNQVVNYNFDEGSGGTAIDSVNGNNGTITGATYSSDSAFGPYSLSFDGSITNYISAPFGVINGLTSFTLIVFFKTSFTDSGSRFFYSGARAAQTNALLFGISNTQLSLFIEGASVSKTHGITVNDGTYHMAAVTRSGTTGTFYIDGISLGTATVDGSTINVSSGGFIIGQDQDSVGGGFDALQAWNGNLDELKIYNRALTQAEITSLFNSNKLSTFYVSGNNQNCYKVKYERDVENMANYVTALGYGDGTNQIQNTFYDASPTFSTVSGTLLSSSGTTIPLVVGSPTFTAPGIVNIGNEQIVYSGTTANSLTSGTRGYGSTTAISHPVGALVYKYVSSGTFWSNPQAAESGSSIYANNLKQKKLVDPSIISTDLLQQIASSYLSNSKSPITRLTIQTDDVRSVWNSVSTGDWITVVDEDTGLNDNFKIMGMEMQISHDSGETLYLEVSNRKLVLLEHLQTIKKSTDTLNVYMQGATNIFTINETENAESGTTEPGPIDLFFEIPSDAVAINAVKFSYRNEAPRIWNALTGNNADSSIIGNSSNFWNTTANISSGASITFQTVTGTLNGLASAAELWVGVSATVSTIATVNPITSYFRLYDSTNLIYYPSAVGVSVVGGIASGAGIYANTDSNHFVIQAPIDPSGKNWNLQIANDTNAGSYSVNIYGSYWTIQKHTHNNVYDISTQTYSTTDVRIYTTNDASGTPSWTERTSAIETALGRSLNATSASSELGLDLTSFFTSTGWKGVRIVTNGNSRHKAQVTVKCFIQSK